MTWWEQIFGPGGTSASAGIWSRIFNGTATADDWMQILGGAGSSVLGYLGADKTADAYRDVANQWFQMGAPGRAHYDASFAPNVDFKTWDPLLGEGLDYAQQAAARSVNADQGGSVYGNPGAMSEIQDLLYGKYVTPIVQTTRSQDLTRGGMGLAAAGPASMASAQATGGTYNALGGGLANLTSPTMGLDDLLKNFKLRI